jgi:hypothetical protein
MNSKSTSSLHQKRTFATGLLIAFFAIGCGSGDALNRQAISGFVSVDGNPLKHGLIRFEPQGTTTGPGVMAEILEGQFCFFKDNGPIPGSHRVEVEATEFHGFAIDNEAAYTAAVMQTGRSPLGRNPIPATYNSNSTLTVFVQDSTDQTFPFDLRSKP